MVKARTQSPEKIQFKDSDRKLLDDLVNLPSKLPRCPMMPDILEIQQSVSAAGSIRQVQEKYGKLFDLVFEDTNYEGSSEVVPSITAKIEAYLVDSLRMMFGATLTPSGSFEVDATAASTAIMLILDIHKVRTQYAENELVVYSNQKYSHVPAAGKISEFITILLVKVLHLSWRQPLESDMLAIISRLAPAYDFSSDTRYSSFINGDYDWKMRQIVPHDASHMTLYTHPIAIGPGAHTALDSLFASRWPDDPIVGEMILEWWGWHFRRVGAPYVVLFYSPGFTGKSTLLKAMAKSIGEDVISHASITQLVGEFGLSKLLTANNAELVVGDFNDEIDATVSWPIQIIKQLSSPDSVLNISRKNKEAINLPARTLLTQATNTMPSVAFGSLENTVGYKRRLVPIDWGNPLRPDEVDEHFAEKLAAELGAIVWDAIDAYNQLEDRGVNNFVRSETVKATHSQWFGDTNVKTPVEEFVEQFVKREDGSKTLRSTFYDAYVEWLKDTDRYSAKYTKKKSFWTEFEYVAGRNFGMVIEHGYAHNHATVELDIILNMNGDA